MLNSDSIGVHREVMHCVRCRMMLRNLDKLQCFGLPVGPIESAVEEGYMVGLVDSTAQDNVSFMVSKRDLLDHRSITEIQFISDGIERKAARRFQLVIKQHTSLKQCG